MDDYFEGMTSFCKYVSVSVSVNGELSECASVGVQYIWMATRGR